MTRSAILMAILCLQRAQAPRAVWEAMCGRARGVRGGSGRACGGIVEDGGEDDQEPPAARARQRTRRLHRLKQPRRLSRRVR